MNSDVIFLFLNAFLSMLFGALIIFRILQREYRPSLVRLKAEKAQSEKTRHPK